MIWFRRRPLSFLRELLTWESVRHDLRDALRSFRRTPAFTLVAVLSLAIAIGANTALVSLLNALVLRDIPVREPSQLVQVATLSPTGTQAGLSYSMFQELAHRQQVFSSLMGWWGASVIGVDIRGQLTKGAVFAATGNLHADLGLRPMAGRLLTAGDMDLDAPSASQVAVLGYDFWRRAFQGDARAIGSTIQLENVQFTVIGVLPQGFTSFGLVIQPDVTVPLTAVPLLNGRPVASMKTRPSQWIQAVGRLKPDVTLDQARAQLATLWPAMQAATVPGSYTPEQRNAFWKQRLAVTSAAKGVEPGLRSKFTRPLVLTLLVALLILLIACVNLASLMLSRAATRHQEIGIRLALGAGRWRIARQMLTEGLLLSVAGAACGVVFAQWTSAAITAAILGNYSIPVSMNVAPDGRVLAFTMGLAVLAALLFSVAPIWRVTRAGHGSVVPTATRSVTISGRTGNVLVAIQVALSLVLVTNAGLLVRSLQQVRAVEAGFRAEGVFVAYPSPRPGGYTGLNNDTYYPQLIERLSALPGVGVVSVSQMRPAAGNGPQEPVAPVLARPGAGEARPSFFTPVAPRFFEVFGLRVLAGRDFAWSDDSRARRVAILSQSLASALFPRENPIGQRVRVGAVAGRQDLEVVGVVADARVYDLKNPNVAAVYVPSLQEPDDVNFKCLVVRGDEVSLSAIKQAVESLQHEYVDRLEPLNAIVNYALLRERLTATLGGFFAVAALLLAAIGLHGLMSYAVAQRQREIGVRMTLGATAQKVMLDVIRNGLIVTLIGIAVGLAGALLSARVVESLLFGVTPRDPVTLTVAGAALIVTAVLACALPAWRAARVDPATALRA